MGCKWNSINYLSIIRNVEYRFWRLRRRVKSQSTFLTSILILRMKWIMFCALDMHRRNINRAISDNMLEELGKLLPRHSMLHSRLTWLTSSSHRHEHK